MITNEFDEKDIVEEAKKIIEHGVYNDELNALTIKEIKALARLRVYEKEAIKTYV